MTDPYSLEAEKAVIGCLLLFRENLESYVNDLDERDFYRAAHQTVFRAIVSLSSRGIGVDLVTLKSALGAADQMEAIGGPAYVASLVDGVPRSTNIEYYIGILKDLKVKRDLLALGRRVSAAIDAGEISGRDLIAQTDRGLLEIERTKEDTDLVPQSKAVRDLSEDMERRYAKRGTLNGVTSGLKDLDDYTRGWQPSDLILLAARPSRGKTSLAMSFALAAAHAGVQTAVFSLEMSREMLEYRILALESGVPFFKILSGWVSSEADWSRIALAYESLSGLPLYIDDTSAIKVGQIRSKCRRQASRAGLGLVVVDYLQLVHGDDRARHREDTRAAAVGAISGELKRLAKDLKVPVIALSQLARPPRGSPNTPPRLSDLRESGALEQDSDLVLFIHQEGESDTILSGAAELILGKHRNGPVAQVGVMFEKETVRFRSRVPEDVTAVSPGASEGPVPAAPAHRARRRLPARSPALPRLSEDADVERDHAF